MPQQRNAARYLWLSAGAIAMVQLFDIAIHAATDQLEPLRITSNVVMLVWVALVARLPARQMRPAGVAALGVYLLLNLIFLALEGVTNGGAPRTALFILVLLTGVLSILLVYSGSSRPSR